MRQIRILLVDDTPGELRGVITTLQEHFSQRDTNLLVDSVQNASGALERLSRTTPNPYDLVLLDIFDVDYKHVLGEVGSRYPYLPIVMFSRQEDPQEIVRCMDLGARSFIFKLDLMIGARARTQQDAARDKQKWERVIDRLDRLAASYRPIKNGLGSRPLKWD